MHLVGLCGSSDAPVHVCREAVKEPDSCAYQGLCPTQEKQILSSISEYFKHEIPEVPYNDEDEFLNVLKEAGLTDG